MLRRRIDKSPHDPGILQGVHSVLHKAPAPRRGPKTASNVGVVALHPKGFGFITDARGDSFFIKPHLARLLLSGDRVEFYSELDEKGQREVRAISRVMRPAGVLLCEVHLVAGVVHIVPDDTPYFSVSLDESSSLVEGDVIAVGVPAYVGAPVARQVPVTLVHNLGPRGSRGFDQVYARLRHGFWAEFSSDELAQAKLLADKPLPDVPFNSTAFVTIDGESTRDIDDAVFAARRPQGGWEVQVAIADVSWFVQPGTVLDAWAAQTCTSVYLPGLTLPMLPHELSSSACSLMEGATRSAVVLHMQVSADGVVESSRFERQLIASHARLTYATVASFLDEGLGEFSPAITASLRDMQALSAVLQRTRRASGCLEFEEQMPVVVTTADEILLDWEQPTSAHRLVESLMLLANTEAAATLIRRFGAGVFRQQPAPDADSWLELRSFAHARGFALPEVPSLSSLAEFTAAQVSDEDKAVAQQRIRAVMRPARYYAAREADVVGHFSLAVPGYTHFTSPIRRYVDLMVHRLLLAPEDMPLDNAGFEALCHAVERCSERAMAARQAERLVLDRVKLHTLQKTVQTDCKLPARVLSTSPRGIRVVLLGWQLVGWVLKSGIPAGVTWDGKRWLSTQADGRVRAIIEGDLLMVAWSGVSRERPAFPEVHLALRP